MARHNRLWVILMAALIVGAALVFSLGFVVDGFVRVGAGEPRPEPLIVTIGYGNIEHVIPAQGTLAAGGVSPDVANLSVRTEVFESEVARVDDAVAVYFTTLADEDRRWHGSGIRVRPTPTIENGIARYPVEFRVDNAGGDLYPGMSTQVFFVLSSAENVLTVPVGALTLGAAAGDGTRRATVEVVRSDGATERRDVVVRATDRVNAEVVTGLVEGDRVVAGTIITPAGTTDEFGGRGRGRQRGDDRFFEPEPGGI